MRTQAPQTPQNFEKTAKAEKHMEYREMEHTSKHAYDYLAEERMDDL